MDQLYTFVGFRADGTSVTVDLWAGAESDLEAQARRFMGQHASCVAMEAWRGGERVLGLGDVGVLEDLAQRVR